MVKIYLLTKTNWQQGGGTRERAEEGEGDRGGARGGNSKERKGQLLTERKSYYSNMCSIPSTYQN